MTPESSKKQPSRKRYLIALFLFLLGPALSIYLIISSLYKAERYSMTFYVPGTTNIEVIAPGEYTLWLANRIPSNFQKIMDTMSHSSVVISDPKTHRVITFFPKPGWKNTTSQGDQHISLGSIQFSHAGSYVVKATSLTPVPHRVYLRKPSIGMIIKNLVYSILLGILGVVAGVILAIITLIQRMAAEPMEQQPTPTNPTPPIESLATTWAMVCHLSGFAGFICPLANIIAPLLIWGIKRHQFPYVDEQGKEAINFQLSITLYYIIAIVLIMLVIGLLLIPVIAAFHIIAMIIASVEVSNGKNFRYPMIIRFVH